MKAAVVPEVHGKWQLKDAPIPKPGPDQVLYQDARKRYLLYRRTYDRRNFSARFPNTIGHEPVGEILELGQNVTTRKVGI